LTMIPRPSHLDHFLFPSTLFVGTAPYCVRTILGSCIAVCLYDRTLAFGGINHYMLPLWTGSSIPSPKYGDVSIDLLIKRMQGLGSRKQNLVAKIFGGATQHATGPKPFGIGERNISIAVDVLGRHGIEIQRRSVGGTQGRKIVFNTGTGQVFMSYLEKMELKVTIL